MKKINLLILFAIFTIGCSQQEPVNFGLLENKDGVYYLRNENKPFSGPVFSIEGYPSGSTGFILKGKFDGDFISTFGDGQLRSLDTYKNGLRSGKFEYYHVNGQISSQGIFVEGKLDGKVESSNYEGNPTSIVSYDNGVVNSATNYTYFENGNLSYIENLKGGVSLEEDGVLNGTITSYEEDGNLDYIENYKDGKIHGLVEEYGENGLLFIRDTYKNGVLNGESIMYFEDGLETIALQGMYENGKKAGVWKSFDNDGILEEEITYDNGKKISVKTY